MERIDKITASEAYQNILKEIMALEQDRVFCRHDLGHCLDVARIAYIISLENHLNYRQDVIYAAALLHDIGKIEQYQSGIPHQLAALDKAEAFLAAAGYSEEESAMILDAIRYHRDKKATGKLGFRQIISQADKLSRSCLMCAASSSCNWGENKKNRSVRY